jgi:uncharacterized protein
MKNPSPQLARWLTKPKQLLINGEWCVAIHGGLIDSLYAAGIRVSKRIHGTSGLLWTELVGLHTLNVQITITRFSGANMNKAELKALLPISADSHVTEPPECYVPHIDPKFRDRAPYLVNDPVKGATFIVEGIAPVGIGTAAAAGISNSDLKNQEVRNFDKLHRGGWDPAARKADMERDGIAAEVVYPSVGMAIYSSPDGDYRSACFDAYNRWLQGYCSALPNKLFGIGQSAALSPQSLIKDMESIKSLGHKGVMLPITPGVADYDDPMYDEAWQASVALDLPLQFHVLTRTAKGAMVHQGVRGGKLNNIMSITRANQDIIGVFIFGGVFERNPKLKMVSVEADAGWVPHYAYRMDHAYERFAEWLKSTKLSRNPSQYLYENVYLTFQDDIVAFRSLEFLNPKRLMWATDFPHTDSIWPESLNVLERHTQGLDAASVKSIVHDSVAELYGLDIAA